MAVVSILRVILSIDALRLPLTGIGWYTLELAQGMLEHPDVDSLQFTDGQRFPLVLPDFVQVPEGSVTEGAAAKRSAGPSRSGVMPTPIAQAPPQSLSRKLREWRGLRPLRAALGRGRRVLCRRDLERATDHVCHGPNYIVPRRSPRSMNTATIHDLSVLRYPDLHPARRVAYMSAHMPRTIECCERLIVSSVAVAHEVADQFAVSNERISVVPLGVRDVFGAQTEVSDAACLAHVGVTAGRFFLFVNGSDPRKNLDAALAALQTYRAEIADDMQLVVTVPPEAVMRLSTSLAAQPGVVLLSYPEEAQLAALYRGAAGLLFPSLYEGFGLPVVESLSSGTPVLISQAETLLEFSELDGVVVVDAGNNDAFCQGLVELGKSELIACTANSARSVAERFAWRHCVDGTLASYALLS